MVCVRREWALVGMTFLKARQVHISSDPDFTHGYSPSRVTSERNNTFIISDFNGGDGLLLEVTRLVSFCILHLCHP